MRNSLIRCIRKFSITTSTIASVITDYLKFVKLTRSENTALTYSKALKEFKKILVKAKIDPEKSYPRQLDGGSGKQLTALPLFARHDKGTGKKIRPITPTTGRNIVAERVAQALGNEAEGHITPHSFRHYFVSLILRASGNLKLAQALARHENIQITQRYAHINDDELDKGYYEIFEKKNNVDPQNSALPGVYAINKSQLMIKIAQHGCTTKF